jgi:hypothetical protein
MCKLHCKFTYGQVAAVLAFSAALGLNATSAKAGPCSADIAQFEAAIRQSAGNPFAGLTASQSVAAQNDRQPTAASTRRAEHDLKAKFASTMARAKRLDAQNSRVGCERALSIAKKMYIL